MRQSDPQSRMQRPQERRQRKHGSGKFIPLLVFILFGLFIATQELTPVHDWVESVFSPEKARIRQTCLREALTASRQPDFARVIEAGEIESTSNGYLVRKVIVGEMAEQGNEARYQFTCYLDAEGRLVRSHREDK